MRPRVACLAALALACLLMNGCRTPTSTTDMSTERSSSDQVRQLAKQFGEHVLKGEWSAAYAMTTSSFQADVSQSQLQQQYEGLLADLRRTVPTFTPDKVEVDNAELPVDEKQAEKYGVKTVPPKNTWQAWLFATLVGNDPNGRAMGLETRLFVVSDNGQDKFALVYFDHID